MNPKGLTDLIGLAKLAETIGKGIGWYLEPQQVRRLAAASADAEITRELGHQVALTISERAAHLRKLESLREQRNLEAIVTEAAALLSDRKSISDDPVENDWTAEFFNQARRVGDPEIQSLWARLLAGEVASPGSYSRRTLAVLRELNKAEAELFAWFAAVVWEVEDDAVGIQLPFHIARTRPAITRKLQDAGLLLFGPFHGLYQVILPSGREFQLRYSDHCYVAKYKVALSQVDVSAARLSNAGRELLGICRPTPDTEIEAASLRHFNEIGLEVRPADQET